MDEKILIKKDGQYKIEFSSENTIFEIFFKEKDKYKKINSLVIYDDCIKWIKYDKKVKKLIKNDKGLSVLYSRTWAITDCEDAKIKGIFDKYFIMTYDKSGHTYSEHPKKECLLKNNENNKKKINRLKKLLIKSTKVLKEIRKIENSFELFPMEEVNLFFEKEMEKEKQITI